MTTSLHNLDDALEFINGRAIHTTQGTFLKVEDVKEAFDLLREDRIKEAIAPRPKTVEQARRMAKSDPEIMKHFESKTPPPGRSVPAAESQSASRP